MIPKCTGRYTCRDHKIVSHLNPKELLERVNINVRSKVVRLKIPDRKDTVFVLAMDEENRIGLITYLKNEDPPCFVHTLNSHSGFRRKLESIGVNVSDSSICIDIG